jgi:hypothetical protein
MQSESSSGCDGQTAASRDRPMLVRGAAAAGQHMVQHARGRNWARRRRAKARWPRPEGPDDQDYGILGVKHI